MKSSLLLLLVAMLLLPACTGGAWQKAFASPSVTVNYDDFGPERMASQFLGPRGQHTVIIAHYGTTRITPSAPEGVRYVNVLQSLNFLRKEYRALPPTAANEPLRERLRATYARLYPLQRKRYTDTLNASMSSNTYGRMNRRLMLPALPPPNI
ncbi:MAG: hypothetical protein JWR15_727 [Prosthecobacter sp.]|nr:hypothetical protein [Prosthecobacter sp.]